MMHPDATSIAETIRGQEVSAKSVVAASLAQIVDRNSSDRYFTTVLSESALADADRIDQRLQAGEDPGPLAGVPFAAKDLFDIQGTPTRAGSKIHAEKPPATQVPRTWMNMPMGSSLRMHIMERLGIRTIAIAFVEAHPVAQRQQWQRALFPSHLAPIPMARFESPQHFAASLG
jgi:hypothetical protein